MTAPEPRDQREIESSDAAPLTDDRRLAYAEYGTSDGEPVVLFHGTPGSRRLGGLFDSAAREAGFRVIAPDRPGFGRSSPWPDRSVRDGGRILEAVLDDAGVSSAGLVAFSGGAPHALAAAGTHADRVERLDVVAGATPPEVSDEEPRTQRFLSALARSAPVVLRGLFRGQAWFAGRLGPALVLSQYTDDVASVPTDAAEIVRADFVEAFAASRRGAVAEFRMTAADWDVRFDSVEAEVCLWHGGEDTNVPIGGVRRLGTRIPGAELRVLDEADHLQTLLESVTDVLSAQRDGERTTGARRRSEKPGD